MNFDLFHRSDYQTRHTVHKVINIMNGECGFHDFEIHMIEIPLLRHYIKKLHIKPGSELEELLCYLGSIGGGRTHVRACKQKSCYREISGVRGIFQSKLRSNKRIFVQSNK